LGIGVDRMHTLNWPAAAGHLLQLKKVYVFRKCSNGPLVPVGAGKYGTAVRELSPDHRIRHRARIGTLQFWAVAHDTPVIRR
jgi:hypothetical protein